MTRVALIDGPLAPGMPGLHDRRDFCDPHPRALHSPAARHAQQMLRAIRHNAPEAWVEGYTVFPGRLACPVEVICTALETAADSEAAIIHCSFGIARPAPRMARAVEAALMAGKRIVASAPARGEAVFPAMFEGVISVQGDARCGPDTWSWLGLPHASFGACALGADPAIRGASVAAAHFTGHLAQALTLGRAGDMRAAAAFQGRERITGSADAAGRDHPPIQTALAKGRALPG